MQSTITDIALALSFGRMKAQHKVSLFNARVETELSRVEKSYHHELLSALYPNNLMMTSCAIKLNLLASLKSHCLKQK